MKITPLVFLPHLGILLEKETIQLGSRFELNVKIFAFKVLKSAQSLLREPGPKFVRKH